MQDVAKRGFFGWTVVWGAFTLAVCGWGLGFYGPPIYLHVIHQTRGWPLGLVAAAVTTHYLAGALTVANLPALHARWGLARVTRAGAVALALGVLGWSLASAPWQLFLAALVSGLGWATLGAAAVNAIVAPWFSRNRPKALAWAYNGASFGGILMSPLWVLAIQVAGFPLAAAIIAALVIAILWILAGRVFVHSPGSLGQRPDGDGEAAAEAALAAPDHPALPAAALWRDRRFISLAAATALGLFAQAGLLAHLFSLVVPALGEVRAGIAMAASTLAAVAGRTVLSWVMPADADRRLVAAASYAVQVAGCGALLLSRGTDPWLIWSGVALFGLGIGNLVYLPPLIAQTEFARVDVPRVVALTAALGQGLYAFAPALFGLVRELAPAGSGAGDAPFVHGLAALVFVAAIAALLAGRPR
ncbi:MFS transporter [Phreatobacter cathodiphilus]|uniref:MFS transporter n=1 Tax=Phreatobacter cathodiphilus TaxID=1868589 RepID=A0A2S0NCE0_9HYPH|nr:MFS transporter [Phreatobacter cathodiphilus]AVO45697.1 MFS transporter [Phreatobacter cathodiphilus]